MRIWTATDDCGNSAMAEQYISLYDDEAPVITCPNDTTLTLDMDIADDTTTVVLGLATAFDNCSSADDIDIVWSDSDFMVDCEGDDDQPEGTMSFTRTFTAYDFCDNAASCEQIITLIDELGPMAEVSDVTLPCAEYDPAATYGEFSAMDNFDTDVAWSWVEDSVYNQTCAGAFMVDRTWTFVDDCGNSTDVHQTLTVFDDVAPVVTFGEMLVEMSCEDYDDALIDENILIEVEDLRKRGDHHLLRHALQRWMRPAGGHFHAHLHLRGRLRKRQHVRAVHRALRRHPAGGHDHLPVRYRARRGRRVQC